MKLTNVRLVALGLIAILTTAGAATVSSVMGQEEATTNDTRDDDDNENNTGDIEEPPVAEEPIGPANDTEPDDNNATDDCDDERLHEAKDKVVEKFMTVGGPVNSVGVGACEIIVTVETEQDAKNFPIRSMDGFPIRVWVGHDCLAGAGSQEQQCDFSCIGFKVNLSLLLEVKKIIS